ncbi:hypothetical protein PV761_03480 [Arthrobacter sp. CC3]|uniref:hypothetical protein n=1 Tax=Arthrobacter sp. CC3 TaxID=3029185 RepID=UPI003264808E
MKAMVLEDLEWDVDARNALERVAMRGQKFQAYDLTELEGLRNPPHANMWGPLFRQAATDGVIRRVGFAESRRPGRKHGLCRVWQVAA